MKNQIILKALRITILSLIAGFLVLVAAVLLGLLYRNVKQSQARSESIQFSQTLFQDPVAVRLRDENEEKCAPKEREYYWVCGLVIAAKPSLPYGYCSTPERPQYFGTLDAASQEFKGGDLTYYHSTTIANIRVSPLNDATPYDYPSIFPPKDLQASEPSFPDNNFNFSVERTWVAYKGMPILFARGSRDWKMTPQERAELPIRMTFRHPSYPLSVNVSVPLEDFENWRGYVDGAVSSITSSVVSVDPSRNCSDPPKNVLFSFNKFDDHKIEALGNWIRDRSNP